MQSARFLYRRGKLCSLCNVINMSLWLPNLEIVQIKGCVEGKGEGNVTYMLPWTWIWRGSFYKWWFQREDESSECTFFEGNVVGGRRRRKAVRRSFSDSELPALIATIGDVSIPQRHSSLALSRSRLSPRQLLSQNVVSWFRCSDLSSSPPLPPEK